MHTAQNAPPPSPIPHTHEVIGAYFVQILPLVDLGISQDDSKKVLKSIEKEGLVRCLKYVEKARRFARSLTLFCSDKHTGNFKFNGTIF